MAYAIAVCSRGNEPSVLPSVRQLFGTIVQVEADGPRRAKKAAKHKARVEAGIAKPKVLGVRLISRLSHS